MMEDGLSTLPICKANRGTLLLSLAWTLLTIAIFVVVLRVWIRRTIRDSISWDDYFIVASLVSVYAA